MNRVDFLLDGMCSEISGADGRTRTDDLLITNQLLYQLSYGSAEGAARHARNEAN